MKKNHRALLVFLLAVISTGCQTWDNFTTLFNTYYNAKRLMTEVEDEFGYFDENKRVRPRIFVADNHTLTDTPRVSLADTPPFLEDFVIETQKLLPVVVRLDSVLQKGSKILAKHPKSDYVAGTLFLMAKSYFYKSEWLPAQLKCIELVESYPRSEFSSPTHLLLAKTYFMQRRFDQGQIALSKTIDIAWGQKDYETLSEAFRLQAEVQLYFNNLEEAIKPYRRAVAQADDDMLRARWQVDLGAILYRRGKFDVAERELRKVKEFTPDILAQFEYQLYLGATLGRLGKFAQADEIFAELLRNSNFKEWRGYTHGERMNLLRMKESRERKKSDIAGVSSMKTDSTSAQNPSISSTSTITSISSQSSQNLSTTAQASSSLGQLQSKTMLSASLPSHLQAVFPREAEFKRENSVGDSAFPGNPSIAIAQYGRALDFFTEGEYTIARKYFASTKAVKTPVNLIAGKYYNLLNQWEERTTFALPLVKRIIGSNEGTDTMKVSVAGALFEIGRIHEQLGNRDSSMNYYELAVRICPRTNIDRARYLHAASRVLMLKKKKNESDSLAEEIVALYPLTEFGKEARVRLGYTEEVVIDTAADVFTSGMSFRATKDYPNSLRQFWRVAIQFPTTVYAPRALYHIGWLYEKVLFLNDSAIYAYEMLLQRYPNSEYAQDVQFSLRAAKLKQVGGNVDSLANAELRPKVPSATQVGQKGAASQTMSPEEQLKLLNSSSNNRSNTRSLTSPMDMLNQLKSPASLLDGLKEQGNALLDSSKSLIEDTKKVIENPLDAAKDLFKEKEKPKDPKTNTPNEEKKPENTPPKNSGASGTSSKNPSESKTENPTNPK